jgi:PAS domain S-box-containing protein
VQTDDDDFVWRPDAALLDGLNAAVVMVDREFRVRYFNDAARAFLGYSREYLIGEHLPSLILVHSDRRALESVLNRVLGDDRWSGELPIRTAEGTVRNAATEAFPVWSNRRVIGAVLVADGLGDQDGPEKTARRVAERLTRLAQVTTELMTTTTVADVAKVVTQEAAYAAGATMSSLAMLVDDETVGLLAVHGVPDAAVLGLDRFPLSAALPSSECIRLGERVIVSGRDEIVARYPSLAALETGDRTMISLPLRVSGRTIGSAGLSFPGRRFFDSHELEYFRILGSTIALTLDRVQVAAEAEDQRTKLRFLADASAELASNLDYKSTLKRVAELAVPTYADWCSIQLVEDGDLRTIAVAHTDPAKVSLALEMQARYPPDRDAAHGAYQVLRTGNSELLPEVPDELLVEVAVDAEQLRLARELNLRSAMTVPLKARGQVLGVITWVAGDGGRRFGPADLSFGEDLARRASVAIDNAELHSELREAAARLQRAVLPEALPTVAGWDVASLYAPAGRTDVGGDFYDVVPLDDGRVVVFVGDVMGRGVAAAAAMAQMRSAVRAYLAVDSSPASVMTKLDRFFERFELVQLVTLVYGIFDPQADEFSFINAGHPPPAVLRADGAIEQLPDPETLPLGVGGDRRVAQRFPFREGDTLVAFTDGLIERRTEDIDAGQQRLIDALPGLSHADLSKALDTLVNEVRDHTRDDDIAVVALRRSVSPAG